MKKLWDWYIEGIEKGIYSSFERISSSFRLARNLWRGVKKRRVIPTLPSFPNPLSSFPRRRESIVSVVKKRPVLFISFGVIVLLLPILFLVLQYRPFSAQAGWFNDNWSYRQTVSLVNTGSAQTDFQVMIATDSASMINAGRMKNDCSDIRITDINGKKLPYWVEPNTCNTAQTKIWTKVPSIPASTGTATSSTIFMYYGNPNAQSESSPKNIFIREISNVAGAWNMDESSWNGTAGEVKDSSGNGNNGTAVSGATTTSGIFGNAGSFNGSTQYVKITTSNMAVVGNFTVSSWIKAGSFGGAPDIISTRQDVSPNAFDMGIVSGTKVHSDIGYGGYSSWITTAADATYAFSTGSWYNVVETVTPNSYSIYVNGVKIGGGIFSSSNPPLLFTTNQSIIIGAVNFTPSQPFNGLISTPRIYSKALSQSEISDLYGTGGDRLGYTTANYPGKELVRKYSSAVTYNLSAVETGGTAPIAYWKFDEGQGTVAKNSMGLEGLVTNLVTNPSLETNITGYYPVGATLSRSTVQSYSGSASGYGTFTGAGQWINIPGNTYDATTVTGSVWVYVTSGTVYFRIRERTSGVIYATASTSTLNQWVKLTITGTPSANGARLNLDAFDGSATFYFDSAQLEQSSSAFPYCDGSITNSSMQGRWNGTAHASTSTCTYTTGDGTINGANWQTEDQCVSGKCLLFGTSGKYVNYGNILKVGAKEFTVSLWFRHAATDAVGWDEALVSKFSQNPLRGYYVSIRGNSDTNNKNKISFVIGDGSDTYGRWDSYSSHTYTDGKWHHVVGVAKPGVALYIYVDGVLDGTKNLTTLTNNDTSDLFVIGSNNYALTQTFNGSIDDVKIYPYARTPAQIKADYNAGKGKAAVAKGANAVLSANNKQGDFLSKGLVGYWKMDEATWSGTLSEVKDASGNGNNGQAQGATGGKAYPAGGKFGNGGYFDGVDDWVSGSFSGISQGGPFTISVWTYFNDNSTTSYKTVVSLSGKTTFGYVKDFNSFDFGTANGYTRVGAGTPTLHVWEHYVAVYDGNKMFIYKNGALKQSTSGVINGLITSYSIGKCQSCWFGGNAAYMNGLIDDLRIYNRALSPQEVSSLYNWAPGPVLNWNFNEGSSTSAYDSSGNGLSGTIGCSGSTCIIPQWKTGKIGKALYFNRNTDTDRSYVTTTSNSLLNVGAATGSKITISQWINPEATQFSGQGSSSGWLIRNGQYNDENYSFLLMNPTINGKYQVSMQGYDGTAFRLGTSTNYIVPAGVWSHLEIIYTQGQWYQIYLNGTLIETVPFTYITVPSTTSFNVGGHSTATNPGQMFHGSIDEVKVYNYARTQKQIVEDMNGGAPAGTSKSMVGYWKFDEGSGGTVHNVGNGGSALDGTWNGAGGHWTSAGKFNKAGMFNGSSDYVSTPTNNTTFDATSNTLTVSAWVYPTALNNMNTILSKGGVDGASGWVIYYSNTGGFNILFKGNAAGNPVVVSTSRTYPFNTWSHIAVVFKIDTSVLSNNSASIYVNGVYDSQLAFSSGLPAVSTQNLRIGVRSDGSGTLSNYFIGSIDEVKLYNYALTAEDIKADYNRGSAQVLGAMGDDTTSLTKGLVGWWKMDEGTGTSTTDSTGKGNTGTFNCSGTSCVNPSWTTSGKYGNALSFIPTSNTSSYLTSNIVNVSSIQNSTITLSTWINPDNIDHSNDKWIARNGMGTDENYGIFLGSPSSGNYKILFSGYSGTWVSSSTTNYVVPSNTWSHIVVVLTQGKSISFYLNGNLIQTNTISFITVPATTAFHIGAGAGSSQAYNGYLDDFRIYNRALTTSEIQTLYNLSDPTQTRSGNSTASEYCIPGDTSLCNPPVADYRFEEGKGTTVQDVSGNNNNGTWSGTGSHYTTGKVGKAGNFDGSGDYVSVNNSSSLAFGTGDFSFSTWIKLPLSGSSSYNGIITKGYNSAARANGWGLTSDHAGTQLKYYDAVDAGGTFNANYAFPALSNGWHYVSVVRSSGTSYKFYSDGQLVGTLTTTQTATLTNSYNTYIGTSNEGGGQFRYAKTNIDQVKIYNYARSPAQIAWDYNKGAPVGWWKMDECQGTTIKDLSGNMNTGTLTVGSGGTQTQPGTCTDGNTASAWNNGKSGKFGSSLNFDGSDDYVSVANSTTNNLYTSTGITVSSWIKINSQIAIPGGIIGKWDGQNGGRQFVQDVIYSGGYMYAAFSISPDGFYRASRYGSTALMAGQWYNLISIWKNDGTMYMWVNGKSQTLSDYSSTASIPTSLISSTRDICIGTKNNANANNCATNIQFFPGQIDDVRIYNYALTPSQVQNVFNEGSAVRFGPTTGSGP
ncbi:DUF2341 domain-containing protein [Candidatus Roizmanbacteria bacterium]|nr:DUF2341 domain-containing protein [Candidatus Roizmanbacteria bacterium]